MLRKLACFLFGHYYSSESTLRTGSTVHVYKRCDTCQEVHMHMTVDDTYGL